MWQPEFHFIRPWWLLALLPWFGILIGVIKRKLAKGNWTSVCDEALLPFILKDKPIPSSRIPLMTGALAGLLTVVALAGPTWERMPSPVFRNDSGLVIALDLSRSMDANDITPSRLIRARFKIADILNRRKDGQTALLVYAGDAFTVTPLTNDTNNIASQLSALTTDIMPEQGSRADLAVKNAVALLNQAGLQQGHVLLITDEVDTAQFSAVKAALGEYKLSVLGVGTAEGAPIKAPEGGFLKDNQGKLIVPQLNAADLAGLAKQGSGVYETITANDSDSDRLLVFFDSHLQSETAQKSDLMLNQWREMGPYLLLLILPLAALSFRKGLLSICLVLMLPWPKTSEAFEWQDLWKTKDQQAQQAFRNQQYDEAASQFDQSDWKAAAHYRAGQYEEALESLKDTNELKGLYNKGNALARLGRFDEAIKAYDEVLKRNPDHEDAKHNKELVEKAKEQQQNQPQDQQENKDDKQQNSEKESKPDKNGDASENSEDKSPSSDSKQPEEQQKNEQEQQQQQSSDSEQQNKDHQNDKAAEESEAESKQNEDQTKPDEKPAEEASGKDEAELANEQWLKRIPDDPSGLLKRKFKYQYGQRGRQPVNKDEW
ncbi:VWA domain-containing protein [Methylicorpusculum sp.]|uniref:VWA domain-containing protein n=2 Tax=Methylicorpusculum sp. TaxID=2713644 RepID=UPI0027202AAD|nr:VWA domain-containing protein [Methylicorpusculum sp.]MDO8844720.1 VWA domain-containing protein [Methylicorpusculum sp.]MDP2178973.1 VWA domain-containing protein [Methylicorpusculum sp.]MDP3528438.1 VWA domain-containing protein [Methylicorpusculum sp.]